MKTQPISNQIYFNGYIITSGLNRKQAKVYESIKDVLKAKVADKDYLVLNINGSTHPHIIATSYQEESKYIVMHTQVKSATVPTATSTTNSLEPQDWLNMADEIIERHQKSDFYKRTIKPRKYSFLAIIRDIFIH